MLAAQTERASGAIEVFAEGVKTYVYFTKGVLVFAEQGTLGDTLGRILVREGRLTSEQYAAAIRHMTRRIVDEEELRFGEAVVELGFLTVEQVQEALGTQVRHKVIRCLMYDEPEWTFREMTGRTFVGHFPARVEPLILAAARLFEQPRIDRILDPERARYPVLLTDAELIAQAFEMRPEEAGLLRLIDGSRTTQEIARVERPNALRADAVLAALLLSGSAEVRLRPTKTETGLPTTVPAPPPAARAVVTESAPRPPAQSAPAIRVPTPFDPAAPLPADPRAARLLAEDAFQKAKMHLRTQAVARALPELRRAATYCPDSAAFLLYVAWAELTLLPHDGGHANRRTALKQVAIRAVKQDPNLAFGFFVLGQLSMLGGEEPKKAIRYFAHALRLDPGLVDAERHLRLAKAREGQH